MKSKKKDALSLALNTSDQLIGLWVQDSTVHSYAQLHETLVIVAQSTDDDQI